MREGVGGLSKRGELAWIDCGALVRGDFGTGQQGDLAQGGNFKVQELLL